MTKVELREAVSGDSGFLFEVRRQAFREYVERQEGWNESRELERHDERLVRQRFRVIVFEGTDVGYLATAVYAVAATYPASLYLHQLMLFPSFQSRGIGSACIRLLSEEADELGIPIRLRVLRVNPRALAFYVANGCKVVGESDSHISLELRSSL
jgi:GNAT superfamily N-acetyltransferase